MASRISDPEQPQISLFSRLLKKDPTNIDKDNTREPLIDGNSLKQSYSVSATILPFFFPALGGLLYGYDIGGTSGATISLESATLSGTTWYNLNSVEIGLVVSGSLYGALIGSSLAFTVADYLGRRRELILSSLAYFVGSLLTAMAPNFPVMVIGRLLFGIGIGLAMHAAPMYIAETSPSQIRGTLISLKEFFIVIGMLFGYISSSLYVDIVAGWRYIYATGAPVCLIMGIGMWWLPPSPRWLLLCAIQGKGNISAVRTTAISCLCRLRGQAMDDTASEEIDAILHELSLTEQHRHAAFCEIFQGKCLKAVIIGVGLLFFQQVTGQPNVLYYAAKILQSAGFSAASDATRVSVLLGILKLLATGVAILVVDRLGRRPLVIGGVSGIAFSLFLLSLYYTILKDLPVAAVIALLLYVGSYQLSFGPIGWLIISEIFPLRIRGRGLSISVLANFATNALVTFAFSPLQVFGPSTKQSDLYEQAITPIVNEVLEGFNCTIFAYGQTGTGKTYTMEGKYRRAKDKPKGQFPLDAGVIPRAAKHIFDVLECQHAKYSMKVTFIELYNEEIIDLLARDQLSATILEEKQKKKLSLIEDEKGGVLVRGLEEEIVTSVDELFFLLERGISKRRIANTLLNKESSRSHSIISITIHIKEATVEGEELIKCGKLNLVDLAGSENISRSGARKGRAREAGEINKSLLSLGRVITALVEHLDHIPYRDSNLTHLLRDSLGGMSRTCMIATISPSVDCLEETLNTLDYAHRAKNIKNRAKVTKKIMKSRSIKNVCSDIDCLKAEVHATREKVGDYIWKERYYQEEAERKAMTKQIDQMSVLLESNQKQIDDLQGKYDCQAQQFADLSKKLEARAVHARLSGLRDTKRKQEEFYLHMQHESKDGSDLGVEALVRSTMERNNQHDAETNTLPLLVDEDAKTNSSIIINPFDNAVEYKRESISEVMEAVEAHSSCLQELSEDHNDLDSSINCYDITTFQHDYTVYEPNDETPLRSEPDVPTNGTIISLQTMLMNVHLQECRENDLYESSEKPIMRKKKRCLCFL